MVAIVLAAVAGQTADAQPPAAVREHKGQIVDAITRAGIAGTATAYSTQARRDGGGMPDEPCPIYNDPHPPYAALPPPARGDGMFTFQVDATFQTYRSQYCAGGYTPEGRDGNSNAVGAKPKDSPIAMSARRR